jgi:hypothetical protein
MDILLLKRGGPRHGPLSLEGAEKLTCEGSPCLVNGVMFAARKEFLSDCFGEKAFYRLVADLPPEVRPFALRPIAETWLPFAHIIEIDRAIWAEYSSKYSYILELIGAASAAVAMRIYHELDDTQLRKYINQTAVFHRHYQNFGQATVTGTPEGVIFQHHQHYCYSRFYCATGVGFFLETILRHGGTDPDVTHPQCMSQGDGYCEYVLEWDRTGSSS